MSELSRLKPDPIPTIHPVPEYAANAALTAVYERTKSGFGVPWMNVGGLKEKKIIVGIS